MTCLTSLTRGIVRAKPLRLCPRRAWRADTYYEPLSIRCGSRAKRLAWRLGFGYDFVQKVR